MGRLLQELEAALPQLQKAVFSQPIDKLSDTKVILRPVNIKGELRYQAESFRDNKAFHKNYSESEVLSYVENELEGRYRQVLIAGGVASSLLFREMVTERIARRDRNLHVCFGKPEYSGDNAVGVALIGAEKLREVAAR